MDQFDVWRNAELPDSNARRRQLFALALYYDLVETKFDQTSICHLGSHVLLLSFDDQSSSGLAHCIDWFNCLWIVQLQY